MQIRGPCGTLNLQGKDHQGNRDTDVADFRAPKLSENEMAI